MVTSNSPTIANLKRAIEITEQIEKLQAELALLLSGSPKTAAVPVAVPAAPGRPKGRKPGKRQLSPEARGRIAAAQRARWAKSRGAVKVSQAPVAALKPQSKTKKNGSGLTAAGRAKLSAALKARWAARKKGAPAPNAPKK